VYLLISPHFGDTTIRSLLRDGAISYVFEVFEQCRLRNLASSAFQLGVVEQIEVLVSQAKGLWTLERPDGLHQSAAFRYSTHYILI